MKNKLYRQGDILIEMIEHIPVAAKSQRVKGAIVLAHGEVTGHAHEIKRGKVRLFKDPSLPDVSYLEIATAMALLEHQEHAAIQLAPGNYKISRQREYSPEEIRSVAD